MPAPSNPTRRPFARSLAAMACALALAGPALAADASLEQVYQAAHGGHVDHALQMMEPVLRDHPGSAKAHYVEAELLAQQGRLGPARTELATAERLAPGLPFVQDSTLQHLRSVLGGQPAAAPAAERSHLAMPAAEAAMASNSRPLAWGLALAVGLGALLGWLLTRANRPRPAQGPAMAPMAPMAAAGPSMAWPRSPVAAEGAVPWGGMSSAPAPAPAAPGWGSQVAAGVAGGLAAGAAAVAGQELGRRLFGHETLAAPASVPFTAPMAQNAPIADGWSDPDFGIRDGGGWDDDVGAADADDGGLGGNWDV